MRIGLPTIVDPRVDTAQVDFWVESLVAGDGEDVVHRYVELQVVDPVVELVEGVTKYME